MRKWIFALLFCCSVVALAATSNKAHVVNQIQQLQKTITLNKIQQQNLNEELKASEVSISDLMQQTNSLNDAIGEEQKQLRALALSQELVLAQLNFAHDTLAKRIRAAYQFQQFQTVKIILNQDDPLTIQRHLNYYQYIIQNRMQLINNTKLALAKLNDNISSIKTHQENLKQLLNEKKLQQSQLLEAQTHRQFLLSELQHNVQSKEEQITMLLSNQKGLLDVITHLKHQTQANLAPVGFSHLHKMLAWPINGKIAAHFGSALDVGNQHLSGVIISATQNMPVHAIYSGDIIFANWLRGFGLLVIINHGNNYMSLYGRNHALYVKVGDHVRKGEIIASTGNSGGFKKPSLYFEIRQNGSAVNPNIWCR